MNILIIDDDNNETYSMINLFFDKYSYKVDILLSGEEALNYLKYKHHDFDLVILDHSIPDVCVTETFKKIRLFSKIPILILTSIHEYIEKMITLGIVSNNYKAMTLLNRIKPILQKSHFEPNKNKYTSYSFSNCRLESATHSLYYKKKK